MQSLDNEKKEYVRQISAKQIADQDKQMRNDVQGATVLPGTGGSFVQLSNNSVQIQSQVGTSITQKGQVTTEAGTKKNDRMIQQEQHGIIQQESPTQDLFIPSSVVTPFPNMIPNLDIIVKIQLLFKTLGDFVQSKG